MSDDAKFVDRVGATEVGEDIAEGPARCGDVRGGVGEDEGALCLIGLSARGWRTHGSRDLTSAGATLAKNVEADEIGANE